MSGGLTTVPIEAPNEGLIRDRARRHRSLIGSTWTMIVGAAFLATAARAATPEKSSPPAQRHALVAVAEALLAKRLSEATKLVIDLARQDSTVTAADRARLSLIEATLLEAANAKADAQRAVFSAVHQDRNVEPPETM